MFVAVIKSVFPRLPLLLISAVLLSACVTTESGGFDDKKDTKKAREYSEELARSYIREGNWPAAKRHLKTALELDDSSAGIQEAMAMVYQNTGEIEEAAKYYRRAVELDGESSRIRLNYASFLYQQQQYRLAADQLERVTEDMLYAKRKLAFVNLARCYLQLNEYEQAEAAFKRAYLMDRRSAGIKLDLALVYYQLANFPESQKFYDAFRTQVKQQPPQALWLGVELADQFGDRNALSSYGLVLKNLYPKSQQYLQYKSKYEQ